MQVGLEDEFAEDGVGRAAGTSEVTSVCGILREPPAAAVN